MDSGMKKASCLWLEHVISSVHQDSLSWNKLGPGSETVEQQTLKDIKTMHPWSLTGAIAGCKYSLPRISILLTPPCLINLYCVCSNVCRAHMCIFEDIRGQRWVSFLDTGMDLNPGPHGSAAGCFSHWTISTVPFLTAYTACHSLHYHQYFCLFDLSILATVRWYLSVVLIRISLIVNKLMPVFIYLLALCVFFWEMSTWIISPFKNHHHHRHHYHHHR